MKTKALFLTVALGAAGVATSMAQVYSQNAVGYINVTIAGTPDPLVPSLALIANQLNQQSPANSTVGSLVPTAPDGFQFFFLRSDGGFDIATMLFGSWDHPEYVIALGAATFASNPDPNPFTITFVGEVATGTLNNPIPAGLSMKSSMVPQAGRIQADLGFGPPNEGDQVFMYNTTTKVFDINSFLFGAWDHENDYQPAVGQGLYIFADPASGPHATWSRVFNL